MMDSRKVRKILVRTADVLAEKIFDQIEKLYIDKVDIVCKFYCDLSVSRQFK
jgi:hypothetical protein